MKKIFKIKVDCPNCANKMEQVANETKGVKNVVINFMTLKMFVDFHENADIDSVMQEILGKCKKIESNCTIYL